MNIKVVTVRNNTFNCVNSKSIYDTKHFQPCACSIIAVRFRYIKFPCDDPQTQLMFIGYYQQNNCSSHQYKREQEPSRIQAKKICCILTKSRDIPDSSCVYCYTQAFSHECQRVLNYKCFDQFIRTNLNWKTPFLRKCKKKCY